MSKAPLPIASSDAGRAAHRFFVIQELLRTPEFARFYTDLLINSPTSVTVVHKRQRLFKSTADKYASKLEDLGVAEELDQYESGSSLWRAEPVSGVWSGETMIELNPVIIAVFGATSVDGDLELFVENYSTAAIVPTVLETIEYLKGNTTRRGIADDLGIPPVEGIAVTQSIERIIAVVKEDDPTLADISFEVEVQDRAIEQAPYRRVDESETPV